MSTTYRVQAFAALAGVTVKTLHHYDRLGLLCPLRTATGYRVYRESDLPRLAQIAALKLVGIPLRDIRPLLGGNARTLDDVLVAQRQMLEAKQQAIGRAIEAIDEARRRHGSGVRDEADILRTLIEAIEMQNNSDVLKRFFDDGVFARWRAAHPSWPGAAWHALLAEVERSVDADPASAEAQALLQRWNALVDADIGSDPEVRRAFTRAWRDWAMKPETRPPLFAGYDTDRILRFIVNATGASALQRTGQGSGVSARPQVSPTRLRLFNEARALLGTSPASEAGRDLGRRMSELLHEELGGDRQLITDLRRAWKRRHHWPEAVVEYVASTYQVDVSTWQAVADYLDAAMEAAGRD